MATPDVLGPCDGRRRCYLPSSLCQREGVTEDDVFAGNSSAGMRNVALEVAATAKASTASARGISFAASSIYTLLQHADSVPLHHGRALDVLPTCIYHCLWHGFDAMPKLVAVH